MKRSRVWVVVTAVVFAGVGLTSVFLASPTQPPPEPAPPRAPDPCSKAQTVQADVFDHREAALIASLSSESHVVIEDGRLRKLQTPQGVFWANKETTDDSVFEMLAEQELAIYGGEAFRVRPGDVVIDCGANIGAFTRRALTLGASRVIAFEPTPDLVEALKRTFAGDDRVTIVPKGVWDEESQMRLSVVPGLSEGNTFVLHPELEMGPVVPLTTIDHVMAELHVAKVDFIKLDIEGAERRALRGAKATLLSSHPRLAIEGHHLPDDPVVLPALVRKLAPTYGAPEFTCRPYRGAIMPEALLFK